MKKRDLNFEFQNRFKLKARNNRVSINRKKKTMKNLFENTFIGYENINLLLVCPVKSHNRVGLARASKLFLFWGRVGKKMKNDKF